MRPKKHRLPGQVRQVRMTDDPKAFGFEALNFLVIVDEVA
jgi:translation elongation factor EF-1beta